MAYSTEAIRAAKAQRLRGEMPTSLPHEFVEYLRDKRVVIVGPAASLLGKGYGPEIDAHDVVVRLNIASPVPVERYPDIGSRTDVLYLTLKADRLAQASGKDHGPEEMEEWRADGVRWLVARQAVNNSRTRRFHQLTATCEDPIPLLNVDPRFHSRLRTDVRALPNTGVIAIAHLLSLPIRSLHVTGFDFYETGYYPGYGGFTEEQAARGVGGPGGWGQYGINNAPHPQDGQKVHLAWLHETDPRLSFDEVASRALRIVPRGPTITALVPMKGDSERVPRKNLRILAGKPLLHWTLKALHEARRIDRVVVDTDSEEIAAAVREHHPQTVVLMRPDHLRDGVAVTGNDLIAWELTQVDGEHFGQFHVTSPLLTPETIDRVVGAYFDSDQHDSLLTVTEHHFWLFRADGSPLNSDPRKLVRSQDLEPLYEDNNAAHLFSRESFATTESRIGERVQMVEIPKLEAVDIDWEEDFELASALMEARLSTTGKVRSRRTA